MRLAEVKTVVSLTRGQKIRVTGKSPVFVDVPTAGKSRYEHEFEVGDVLRVYSVGAKWVVIEPVSAGKGVYRWKSGNKVTNFETKEYRWRVATEKFDKPWYEEIGSSSDAPPDTITDFEQAKEWIKENGTVTRLVRNHDGTFDATTVTLSMRVDKKIRVKFRNVESFRIEKAVDGMENLPIHANYIDINLGKFTSLKDVNISDAVSSLILRRGEYTDLSTFPDSLPNLKQISFIDAKNLRSISGLKKKFPKLEIVQLEYVDELKKSLLDLTYVDSIWSSFATRDRDSDLKKALDIIKRAVKEAGNGPQGKVRAQRDLIDADLEDYAD